jgi:hypothetical protein
MEIRLHSSIYLLGTHSINEALASVHNRGASVPNFMIGSRIYRHNVAHGRSISRTLHLASLLPRQRAQGVACVADGEMKTMSFQSLTTEMCSAPSSIVDH